MAAKLAPGRTSITWDRQDAGGQLSSRAMRMREVRAVAVVGCQRSHDGRQRRGLPDHGSVPRIASTLSDATTRTPGGPLPIHPRRAGRLDTSPRRGALAGACSGRCLLDAPAAGASDSRSAITASRSRVPEIARGARDVDFAAVSGDLSCSQRALPRRRRARPRARKDTRRGGIRVRRHP